MKSNLYQLTEFAQQIDSTIELLMETGTPDPEAIKTLTEALTENKEQIAEKLEAYARVILNFEAEAEMRKNEYQRQRERAKVAENTAKRLKSVVKEAMETLEMQKVLAGAFTVSIAKNGGVQPIAYKAGLIDESTAEILDHEAVTAGAIEKEFVIWKPFLNKAAIREHLEAEKTTDWATLMPRGSGVRIK